MNKVNPNAKAANAFALSNSWSPTSKTTICTVTAVTDSNGFAVKFAVTPAAITTIMVSPIALDTANSMALIIPGNAAGNITFVTVSDFVEPNAAEPSLRF